MSFSKIQAPSVKDVFVEQIEHKILSGELKIGEKLPSQKELCRSMGVSLTIVNSGISQLAAKGLVEVVPRRGVYVSDYRITGTPETFFDILQFNGRELQAREIRSFTESRLALDPFVVKLVIERATDEEILEAEKHLKAMKKEQTDEEFCFHVTDFFQSLYRMTDNSFLPLLYHSTLKPQVGMYGIFVEKNGRRAVIENAEEILRAVQARDTERAQKAAGDGLTLALEGPLAIV